MRTHPLGSCWKWVQKKFDGPWWIKKEPEPIFFCILLEALYAPHQATQPQFFYLLINGWFRPFNFHTVKNESPLVAPMGTIWGSFCIVVTLSDIETIWIKFGQNPGFSLINSVLLTPGQTVKLMANSSIKLNFVRHLLRSASPMCKGTLFQ